MTLSLVGVLTYIYLPYDFEDEVTPDEVIALDEEIDDFLLTLEPSFQDLYNNRYLLDVSNLTYVATQTPLTNQENYKKNVESVVYITTEDADDFIYIGSGSILTEDGVIMTNYHLVEGATKVVVTTIDGNNYEVKQVLASNELVDIVFLKINADNLTPISIGDSDSVVVGDKTLVIGHGESFINSLSLGNVSGFRSYESKGQGLQIQITNPISSGNSGGVVLNEYGEIIAIPTWILGYEDNIVQVQNINFAVPINEALKLLE